MTRGRVYPATEPADFHASAEESSPVGKTHRRLPTQGVRDEIDIPLLVRRRLPEAALEEPREPSVNG